MHEIKSFKIFQTAKVIAAIYGILFLIVAIIELVLFMAIGVASGHPGRNPPMVGMVIVPVLGTIFGFISVAFICWLYNLIAPRIGGIAFELTPRNQN